jgi:hypothetical protein
MYPLYSSNNKNKKKEVTDSNWSKAELSQWGLKDYSMYRDA